MVLVSNSLARIARQSLVGEPPRSRRSFPCLLLLISLGLFTSPIARASETPYAGQGPNGSIGLGPSFAIADFDGDQRLDLASIESSQTGATSTSYSIQLHLTGSGRRAVQLIGPSGGLAIEARDVNGDSAVDLVVTTAWLRQPVAILLNDGHGRFSRAEPSQFSGAFSDPQRNWGPSSQPISQAVGMPSQSRSSIWRESATLPDVRGPTESVQVSSLGFLRNTLLNTFAGRAPPSEVSSF